MNIRKKGDFMFRAGHRLLKTVLDIGRIAQNLLPVSLVEQIYVEVKTATTVLRNSSNGMTVGG